MSVKDKIAMWNNMSTSGGTQPQAVKPVIEKLKPVYPPREVAVEKSIVAGGPEVDTTSILTPSMLRKRMQEQSGGQEKLPAFLSNNNSTPVKAITKPVHPVTNNVVAKPIVQSQPPAKHQQEQTTIHHSQKQSENIETFTERKKKLEQQIEKNHFHFNAPIEIKKVESITIEREGPQPQVIIEKEVPLVGVKERAQQLSQFYQNKKQQEPQHANCLNIDSDHHEQSQQPQHSIPEHIQHPIINNQKHPSPEIPHETAPHVEPVIQQQEISKAQQQQVPKETQQQQAPKQIHQQPKQPAHQQDYNSEESSLAIAQQGENINQQPQTDEANELMLRLRNKRNQQKRRLFESDED